MVACCFNPMFKRLEFVDETVRRNTWRKLRDIVIDRSERPFNGDTIQQKCDPEPGKLVFDISDDDELHEHNCRSEVKKYSSNADTSITSINDVLHFWNRYQSVWPRLASVAALYLSVASTEASVERLFSKAGQTITDLRTTLKPELIDMIVVQTNETLCL